jgi:hypothetical protein
LKLSLGHKVVRQFSDTINILVVRICDRDAATGFAVVLNDVVCQRLDLTQVQSLSQRQVLQKCTDSTDWNTSSQGN